MRLIVKWLLTTLSILIVAHLLPGVIIKDFTAAVLTALVLGLANAVVKPILIVLTLPLTIMSLGLFILVLNAILVLLTSALVPGFEVHGFWWAVLFSLLFSLVSFLLNHLIPRKPDRFTDN